MEHASLVNKNIKNWYKLDNAAKIYPAIKNSKWVSIYRLSVTLKAQIDPVLLQRALDITIQRFPGFSVMLKKGIFWYYLEQNTNKPLIQLDAANPCIRIGEKNDRGFLFRVRYYNRRIALEVFHSVSDGGGGLTFLKTLTAEYLKLFGYTIPPTHGVLDCSQQPDPEELEDSFLRYSRFKVIKSRKESKAYHIKGTSEQPHIRHVTSGQVSLQAILAEAKKYHVSLTEYLAATYIMVLNDIQSSERKRKKLPVKVSIPVNLRKFYSTGTLRNFSLYVNPGINPNYGKYSFEEILSQVHHFLRLEINEKSLNAQMGKNVQTERNLALRLVPLFIKNIVMAWAFRMVGESRFTSALSNVGAVDVPEEMAQHIENWSFILATSRYNKIDCAVISFKENLVITFSRTIKESKVERAFFTTLVKRGLHVIIESNQE